MTTAGELAPGQAKDRMPMSASERVYRWVLRIVVWVIFAFLVIPVLIVIAESFNGVNYLSFPLEGFSLQAYRKFFNDASWVDATLNSARIAGLAALIATIVGTVAAWALARTRTRAKGIAYALLYSPVVMPVIVMAISYYAVFARLKLIGEWAAVSVVYSVMGIPFVLVAVSSALQHIDPELEKAARTLGAGPIRAMVRITLPRLTSAIGAGAIFAFVTAFDEAVIILFVSGSGSITLPRKLWDSVRYDLDPTLAVAGTILIVVSVGLFMLAEVYAVLRDRRRSRDLKEELAHA